MGAVSEDEHFGAFENVAQDAFDFVEVRLFADHRRRELDDRVAAVVGAAVDAGVEELLAEEAPQQPFGFFGSEAFLGGLVFNLVAFLLVAVLPPAARGRAASPRRNPALLARNDLLATST